MSDFQVLLLGYGAWAAFFLLLGLLSNWFQRRKARHEVEAGVPDYRLRARLKRMARPTLLLVPAKSPGFSKLGGLPELPAELAWPIGREGPLAFVAQLDLGAFRPYGGFDWLPDAGRLYFFFDEARNGAADCGTVVYAQSLPAGVRNPPTGLGDKRPFAERRVGFMRFRSFPSADWLDEDLAAARIDPDDWTFAQDADLGDDIEHRIGGYPSEIQGGQMAIECEYLRRGLTYDYRSDVPDAVRRAARQWRLLLQIDSDPALSMNWWDAGRLYVFIRTLDARAGDFSKTVTITPTY